MKANVAPEKIYIQPSVIEQLPHQNIVYTKPLADNSIEYIRKDSLIEKACDAYCKVCGHYHHTVPTYICRQNCYYFEDFRKYMEGE